MYKAGIERICRVQELSVARCVEIAWAQLAIETQSALEKRLIDGGIQDVNVPSRWFVSLATPAVSLSNRWSITVNSWLLKSAGEADVCFVVAQQLALVLLSNPKRRLHYFLHDFTVAEELAAEELAMVWGFRSSGQSFQTNPNSIGALRGRQPFGADRDANASRATVAM